MASTRDTKPEEKMVAGKELIQTVFSWTISDVMNKTLYKNKVQAIPRTFRSSAAYLDSFVSPLIEETRAELCSSMESISVAPLWRIEKINEHKDYKLPTNLLYELILARETKCSVDDDDELQHGYLVAITDHKPKSIDDINRPSFPYLIAVITKSDQVDVGFVTVTASRPIEVPERNSKELFAVCLSSLTTNIRVWKALQPSDYSKSLIERVLEEPLNKAHRIEEEDDNYECPTCSLDASFSYSLLTDIRVSGLNSSQKNAVMDCVVRSKCSHGVSVKLIWGPPGTGKTKTVACLLESLLKRRCRTVTCAPTNIAVVEVAKRLVDLWKRGANGLGDILLFGNKKRMKIDDDSEVLDIFLDHRVEVMEKILSPIDGWSSTLRLIIHLLQNPGECYRTYFRETVRRNQVAIACEEELDDGRKGKSKTTKGQSSGSNGKAGRSDEIRRKEKNKRTATKEQGRARAVESSDSSEDRENREERERSANPVTFLEYIQQRCKKLGKRLIKYIVELRTHLPASILSLEQTKNFMEAHEKLEEFFACLEESSGRCSSDTILKAMETVWRCCKDCLEKLPSELLLQRDKHWLRKFYFDNACLLFGTASGMDRLRDVKTPIQMLLIDEAAQLKECESTIPLQLPSLRHVVLVGDEKQLNAMVHSKINEKAGFGRSLFERLVILRYKKHLLNTQYRMHPSISSFPNRAFYKKKILDGPNVKEDSYQKQFLDGAMFGPYSFININNGIEQTESNSKRNTTEVAAIENIVERLSKAKSRIKPLTVGIISPYNAQVNAIRERLKRFTPVEEFSVNVRSVDGFQGGEEDIILFSAVRSNATGNIGFLCNRQRTNVAITRAKYCVWILGNGSTLEKSGSVWADLVKDAKKRRCYHDAEDDKELSLAISSSLIEHGQVTLGMSLFLKPAPWKVIYSDDFHISLMEAKKFGVHQKALLLLQKLAFCWRPVEQASTFCTSSVTCGKIVRQIRICSQFTMIWSVDIEKEKRHETQVIKVWGIKRFEDTPDLVEKLDAIFKNYSFQTVARCQYQHKEGNLVVPMRWNVDATSVSNTLAALDLN